jgi:2-oxoglutarate ferredoxin oxidoreductase subunit alpha
MSPDLKEPRKSVKRLDRVVVRLAGDSGDGMQITGSQFTNTAALYGNDLATFPDYPAEIRAPAGTVPGVSGFQVNFASTDIFTPGDAPDVLVAMNPAALKVNIGELKPNGLVIVNVDSFRPPDLEKANLKVNPLEDGTLDKFQVVRVELTRLTRLACEGLDLSTKEMDRCKNFYALGMLYWLYSRKLDNTVSWLQSKFKDKPEILEANIRALKAGYNLAETTELFREAYEVPPAQLAPGKYRNMSGNTALALGLIAASQRTGLKLFQGSYPITPASDILHELSMYKNFGVVTFQAEDEIAAIGAAIGASLAGALGVTTTSGPGMALKSEAMGLAVMLEIPLVVCDIQRGGPSTGLPTKTEQADLFQAMFGRNSEAPIPVIAAATPGDCFHMAFEAARLATKYMTPVILLSDGYIANGSEPWLIPKVAELPDIKVKFRTDPEGFKAYLRDPTTLARPWVIPGTPGLEHRVGGIEKQDVTGNISYDPENHDKMCRLRAEKVARIAKDVPELEVRGDADAKLLILGWGSTYGSITGATVRLREQGRKVASAHLRYLNPFPRNLGDVLARFERVMIPEMNLGQLAFLIQGRYLKKIDSFNKVQGRPFTEAEVVQRAEQILETLR